MKSAVSLTLKGGVFFQAMHDQICRICHWVFWWADVQSQTRQKELTDGY